MDYSDHGAWNGFVEHCFEAALSEVDDRRRAAAIACVFMCLANSGGLNSFFTSSYDLSGREVLEALTSIGAMEAAKQVGHVLRGLDVPLMPSSRSERWDLLEKFWTEDLDAYDLLSKEADSELIHMLEQHVRDHEEYYAALERKWF